MTDLNAFPAAVDGADGAVAPSALSSVRFLVTELIAELDGSARALERRIKDAETERTNLRERLEQTDVIRHHVLKNLNRLRPDDVDNTYRQLSQLTAQITAVEELLGQSTTRLNESRQKAEALRTVNRSLDDLSVNGHVIDEDAARFRSASRQVFQIIEEERVRIARDMHDGPAQAMANLVLQAEVLERLIERDPQRVIRELADFKAAVRDVLDETRRMIFDLRPMTLDDLGLVPTLRKLIKEFGDKTGIVARFHVVGDERRLPGGSESVLFRIIQEALTNVRKHARASLAEVTLTQQPHRVVAVVKDDGEGFDVAATEARLGRTRNLGLISMRERADLEKGSLEIRSQIGRGTEVRVALDF